MRPAPLSFAAAALLAFGAATLPAAPPTTQSPDVVAASRGATPVAAMAGTQAPRVVLAVLQDSQPPAKGQAKGEVDVNIQTGGAWYTNPFWIVVGVAALIIIIALIVSAGRGGGTTVVR